MLPDYLKDLLRSWDTEGLLALSSLAVLGIALRICVAILQRKEATRRGYVAFYAISTPLIIAGGFCLGIYLAGLLIVPIGLFLLLARGAFLAGRRRDDSLTLMEAITQAQDRNMQPQPIVEAIAGERKDEFGLRVEIFGSLLQRGVTLSPALRFAKLPMPAAAAVTAEMSEAGGELGPALREMLQQDEETRTALRGLSHQLWYSLAVVFVILALAPTLTSCGLVVEELLDDNNIPYPYLTSLALKITSALEFSSGFGNFLLLVCFLVGIPLIIHGRFGTPANYLLLRRWALPRDASIVLRGLALAVRQSQPIGALLERLSKSFPNRLMRKRLRSCVKKMERGQDWLESLRAGGFISQREFAVLRSGVQAQNLSFALEAVAGVKRRRWLRRSLFWGRAIFFGLFLVLISLVAIVFLGGFLPLPLMLHEAASMQVVP